MYLTPNSAPRCPHRAAGLRGGWRPAWPLLLTVLIATVIRGLSQTTLSLITTLEQPGVQNSTALSQATGVFVEGFDTLPLGEKPNGFSSTLGKYSGGIILGRQPAGGADETQFFQVANAKKPETLTFNTPQRYFGLWWSNADPKFPDSNTLTFSLRSAAGLTIKTPFNTGNLLTLINTQPNAAQYFGNPNQSERTPDTLTKAYAFVNFFAATGIVINSVAFSNLQETFSSDNHTIASSFGDIGGSGSPPAVPPGNTDVGPGSSQIVGGGKPVTVPTGTSVDTDPGSHVMVPGGTTVAPGALVTGNGMVTTPSFVNHGLVSPGGEERAATIGTLTIDGNYKQSPTGVLSISVNGPQCPDSDKLIVTGSASLDGLLVLSSKNLVLSPKNSFQPSAGDHYTILFASGGVTGMFAQVVDTLNTNGLTRADIFSPNGVIVAYLPGGFGPLNLSSTIPIPANSICDVNAILVSALDPNASQLAAPFDIWFSLAQQQRFNLENHFDDIMAAPVPEVPPIIPPSGKETVGKGVVSGKEEMPPPVPEKHWNLWATGYGDWVNIDSSGLAKGYGYTTGGVTAGLDYRIDDHYVIGILGGYSHAWTDLKPGSIDLNSGWGGIYGGFYKRGVYALGAVYGGGSSFDTSRATVVGDRANGSSNTQQWSTFITVGYDLHCGQLTIGPLFAAQYSYVNMDSFTEHGSIVNLSVRGESQESWRTDLGFRAWYTFQLGKVGVRPFVRVAWNHEYRESNLPISVSLLDIQGSAPVTVAGPSLGHDSAVVNAGVSAQLTPTISTYVSYDGQLGRNKFDYNGVSGGFNFSF